MRNLVIVFFLIISSTTFAQDAKYLTKKGTINFEASVPSFEEVKAKNTTVTAILNLKNGEIAALALVKGFRFKNALMEEHFNENYIESDDYPKSKFKGKLLNFDSSNIKSEYTIEGVLTLHGKSKDISVTGALKQDGNTINLIASFKVKPEDFDISIPKVVSKKIAEDIQVSFDFDLIKK